MPFHFNSTSPKCIPISKSHDTNRTERNESFSVAIFAMPWVCKASKQCALEVEWPNRIKFHKFNFSMKTKTISELDTVIEVVVIHWCAVHSFVELWKSYKERNECTFYINSLTHSHLLLFKKSNRQWGTRTLTHPYTPHTHESTSNVARMHYICVDRARLLLTHSQTTFLSKETQMYSIVDVNRCSQL